MSQGSLSQILKEQKILGQSQSQVIYLQETNESISICHSFIVFRRDGKQTRSIQNPLKRAIKCMTVSQDNKRLAMGENNCKHPEIIVIDISHPLKSNVIMRMKGHRFGMAHLLFSPKDDYLISVGTSQDNGLIVHETKQYTRISQNKVSQPIHYVSLDNQQTQMVTCGQGFIRTYPMSTQGTFLVKQHKENTYYLGSQHWSIADNLKDCLWVNIQSLPSQQWIAISSCGEVAIFQQGCLRKSLSTGMACSSVLVIEEHLYLATTCSISIYQLSSLQHLSTHQTSHHSSSIVHLLLDQYRSRILAIHSTHLYIWWTILPTNQLQILNNQHYQSMLKPLYDLDTNAHQLVTVGSHLYQYKDSICQQYPAVKEEMRSVRLEGDLLICGDQIGQVSVYIKNIHQQTLQAHDQEVLCIDILKVQEGKTYIVTGSRDRLIHLFCLEEEKLVLVSTVDKHQSSVTRVHLLPPPSTSSPSPSTSSPSSHKLVLLSCAGDRVFLRHTLQPQHSLLLKQTYTENKFYDMAIYQHNTVYLLQDKKITSLELADIPRRQKKALIDTKEYIQGKHVYLENIRGCVAYSMLIVFSTDKVIRVRDINKSLLVLQKIDIGDIITRIRFSQDTLYLSSIEGILYLFTSLHSNNNNNKKNNKLQVISKQINHQVNSFEQRNGWDCSDEKEKEKEKEEQSEKTPLWAKTRQGTQVPQQIGEEDNNSQMESVLIDNIDSFINLNTNDLHNNRLGNHQPRMSITSQHLNLNLNNNFNNTDNQNNDDLFNDTDHVVINKNALNRFSINSIMRQVDQVNNNLQKIHDKKEQNKQIKEQNSLLQESIKSINYPEEFLPNNQLSHSINLKADQQQPCQPQNNQLSHSISLNDQQQPQQNQQMRISTTLSNNSQEQKQTNYQQQQEDQYQQIQKQKEYQDQLKYSIQFSNNESNFKSIQDSNGKQPKTLVDYNYSSDDDFDLKKESEDFNKQQVGDSMIKVMAQMTKIQENLEQKNQGRFSNFMFESSKEQPIKPLSHQIPNNDNFVDDDDQFRPEQHKELHKQNSQQNIQEHIIEQQDYSEIIENIEENETKIEPIITNVQSVYITKEQQQKQVLINDQKEIEIQLDNAIINLKNIKEIISLNKKNQSQNIEDKQQIINKQKFQILQEEIQGLSNHYDSSYFIKQEEQNQQNQMLEAYSNQLVKIFQQKVQNL